MKRRRHPTFEFQCTDMIGLYNCVMWTWPKIVRWFVKVSTSVFSHLSPILSSRFRKWNVNGMAERFISQASAMIRQIQWIVNYVVGKVCQKSQIGHAIRTQHVITIIDTARLSSWVGGLKKQFPNVLIIDVCHRGPIRKISNSVLWKWCTWYLLSHDNLNRSNFFLAANGYAYMPSCADVQSSISNPLTSQEVGIGLIYLKPGFVFHSCCSGGLGPVLDAGLLQTLGSWLSIVITVPTSSVWCRYLCKVSNSVYYFTCSSGRWIISYSYFNYKLMRITTIMASVNHDR